ncbi:Ig-like domain-containing protein [Streptomyces sp. NPDC051577]|uniref:Ig-like domain-containing protein n=1 Tax=Streptomyces sp. NPDC051577 TaxID=3155166 RepID=UPI0034172272
MKPLTVPVKVDALAANSQTCRHDVWQRFTPTYRKKMGQADFVSKAADPEPVPFQNSSSPKEGVHLRWELPEALCTGHESGDGLDFPPAPNRWLVLRYSGADTAREATAAWVVVSDHISNTGSDGGSPIIDPHDATKPTPAWLGRLHDLFRDGPWSEPATAGGAAAPFTALTGGLPLFTVFQPYNVNVLSMCDPLTDIDPADAPYSGAPLSYLVLGWHSHPDLDVLSPANPRNTGRSAADILDSLGWSATDATGVDSSVYVGTVLALEWSRRGQRPASDLPSHTDVKVAVGHSALEAHNALVSRMSVRGSADAHAMAALCSGRMDLLGDRYGISTLNYAEHALGFSVTPGGEQWTAVDAKVANSKNPLPVLSDEAVAKERALLDRLNVDQRAHDEALAPLSAMRERLYFMWSLRKQGKTAQFGDELDPHTEGTLAHTIKAKQHQLEQLRSKIPYGRTAAERRQRIAEFIRQARAHGELAAHREIKAVERSPFHAPMDPVVVVKYAQGQGVQDGSAERPLARSTALPVRLPKELLTAYRNDASPEVRPPAKVPGPPLQNLPSLASAITREFWLLDRAGLAGELHEDTAWTGTSPEHLRLWRQPWLPVMLQWTMEYFPIDQEADGSLRWTFDGFRYRWKGRHPGEVITPYIRQGRALINPQLSRAIQSRARHLAQAVSARHASGLRRLGEEGGKLDVLSQEMTGLGAAIAHRLASPAMRPEPGVMDLLAGETFCVPDADPEPAKASRTGSAARRFQPVRSAQARLRRVTVVDAFGRCLDITNMQESLQYEHAKSTAMTPGEDRYVTDTDQQTFFQLPPRLNQPARLGFEFIQALSPGTNAKPADEHNGGYLPHETPVCGWLQALRHLGDSIIVYGPTGQGLGEIRLAHQLRPREGSRTGGQLGWLPLPDSPYHTFQQAQEQTDSPHLGKFLTALGRGGAPAFTQLLSLLETSTATAPQAPHRTIQHTESAGPVIALARARLCAQLADEPLLDPTVTNIKEPPTHPLPGRWNIRLGGEDHHTDGLLGFFHRSNYDTLYEVAPLTPNATDTATVGYTRPITGQEIALAFRAGTGAPEATDHVTMLLNPWTAVHALSDILPVQDLKLPEPFVRDALAGMNLALRLGPLLAPDITAASTATRLSGTGEHVGIIMPMPSETAGTWHWSEKHLGTWTRHSIIPPEHTPQLTAVRPHARDGYLCLTARTAAASPNKRLTPPSTVAVDLLKRDESMNGLSCGASRGTDTRTFQRGNTPIRLTAQATRHGQPAAHARVTFTITGNTGSRFDTTDGRQTTVGVTADRNGLATAPPLIAGATPGMFTVTAHSPGHTAREITYQLSVINP